MCSYEHFISENIDGHPFFNYDMNLLIYDDKKHVIVNTQLFGIKLSGPNPFYEFHFDHSDSHEKGKKRYYECYITDLTSYIKNQPPLHLFLDSQLLLIHGKKIRIPLSFDVKHSLQNKNRMINVPLPLSDYIVLAFDWDAMNKSFAKYMM